MRHDYLQSIKKAISSPATAQSLVRQGVGCLEDVYAALVRLEASGQARVVMAYQSTESKPVAFWESMQ